MIIMNKDYLKSPVYKYNREAYGKALVELGEENQDIVVLDADLSASTKTILFAKRFPERFINVGIAEQNLMKIGAGLARSGKTPFVSTFAIFGTGRAWEQIRNGIAFDNLSVKIVLSHGGMTLSGDGPTHQMIEDIAIMRVIPNMRVMVPADAVETRHLIKFIADKTGPFYVRLPRLKTLVLYDEDDYRFNPDEYDILADGSDVAIFTYGMMIEKALRARVELKTEGISARVINANTIKPLAENSILKAAKDTGAVMTVEDHHKIGGMGGAIAELLGEKLPTPMKIIGINDTFGTSGRDLNKIHSKYGLTAENIVNSAKELVNRRG